MSQAKNFHCTLLTESVKQKGVQTAVYQKNISDCVFSVILARKNEGSFLLKVQGYFPSLDETVHASVSLKNTLLRYSNRAQMRSTRSTVLILLKHPHSISPVALAHHYNCAVCIATYAQVKTTSFVVDGRAIVTPEGVEPLLVEAGDLVTCRKELRCNWWIQSPISKEG